MTEARDADGRFCAATPTGSRMERFCAANRPGFVVYAIVNTNNGKRYYGSSRGVRRRMWTHLLHLRNGTHHSIALQRAFVKYGEASFDVEILSEHQDHQSALRAEQSALDMHYGKLRCYNASPSAASPILEPVALERAAEARRRSAKWRASLRVDQIHTPTAKAKSRAACAVSESFRENVLAQGRRMRELLSKPVLAVPVDGGDSIRFPSQEAARIALGISRSGVSERCRGIRVTPIGGYYFRLA